MHYIKAGLLVCFAIALGIAALAWLFLSSALFSSVRTTFVEGLISKELGQDVVITDELHIGIGRQLQISAIGLVLPGSPRVEADLAAIERLEFDVSAQDLWNRKLSLSNLSVGGIRLNLIQTSDGETNWSSISKSGATTGQSKKSTPLSAGGFLSDRKVDLTDIGVVYKSEKNGLELDLQLPKLLLQREKATNTMSVIGNGSLNGEKFELNGTFPADEMFQVKVDFDQVAIAAQQVPHENGLQVRATAQVSELGQLLDALKLNRVLEGSGNVGATFSSVDGIAHIDELAVLAELDGGQSLSLTGQIGELGNPEDVSLTTRIRLYPEDAEPAPAVSRYDLKLIAVDMVIDSVPGQIPQREMVIQTNGFTLDTSGEGPPPIKFSELSRTAEGALRVGNINLRIGNPASPFLILNGSVEDALQLQGIAAEGLMDISAGSLISPELAQKGRDLGRFSGVFHLNGDVDQLALTDLEGTTSETDVWNLSVTGTVKNVLKFEDLDLGIDVDVPSGADLLESMSLERVETGKARLGIDLVSKGTDWNANARVEVAESVLSIAADLDDATSDPILQGKIESDLIKIDQIQHILAAVTQLRKLGAPGQEGDQPAEDNGDQDGLRDVTLQPIGRSILLSGMDVDVDIDLRHIEGAKGISSLQSELTLKENELKAGPLKFEYGGGSFDVSGEMDLSDETHRLTLSGEAGGWQLDSILQNLNFKKGASGTLYANFSVNGEIESAKHFINTMNGNATISMRDGSIETQLLDLAGLGVLPWVFTKEKQKVAPIVCLRAPLAIAGGNISTKQTTLETDHVQVVVFGDVSLAKRALDLNLQPRKIGEPLSRSPWPVTLKGPLNKPNIKVKDGPKRLKRSDGADKMPAQRKLCVPDILQLQ